MIPYGNFKKNVLLILRLLVIAAGGLLVAVISVDSLRNMSFAVDPFYDRLQTWVCYFFLCDIAVECALSEHRWRYLWRHLLFVVVSIPYTQIIDHFHLQLPEPVIFAVHFMPLLLAAYVVGLLVGATARNRMTSMFATYMTILVASVYFGSIMFFIAEHPVNPGVTTIWDAAWWAIMDMTTCGSSISELTPTGQTLAVILSAEGLVLFPVFTVYITAALTGGNSDPATPPQAVSNS